MDLDVEGRHALLFDDDANAAFVNSRLALVPWSNDESLLIDRYDVRHLLDRIPPRPPKRSRIVEDTGGGGVSRSQLDAERFLDLPPPSDDDSGAGGDDKGELVSEATQRSDATGSGAYQAVPFSYGNSDISLGSNGSESRLNYSGFRPPFAVPESLRSNLPPTEKLHQIIARTAIFVSEHGGQSEIVLRVKQGDNPTFGFLMPDNQLHAYFRFLVEHPQLLKVDNVQEEKKLDDRENVALVPAGGALSLLGSVYGFGEEEDTAPQADTKEMESSNPKIADICVLPHEPDGGESNSKVALEEKQTIKQRVASAIKEKTLLVKRNHFVNGTSISKRGDNVISLQGTVDKPQSSQADKTDEKPLFLEPPSFLKRTMDKIVEFILRNGKEFETVLIEQDKTAGRFPFLSPSNQYHAYYIKVLQEALESKLLSKNKPDVSKRRSQEVSTNDASANEQSGSWSMDPHRKEKFKMVIGGPKKDSNEPPPKPARQVGVSADQAAAIVLAATRGRSPANFKSISVTDSETGRTSSIGGLSPSYSHQHRKSVFDPSPSNVEAADVSVATAIAKTVALAASSEADSSDASLTKEQKLKAERLKRAKMFAAMIKSGRKPIVESVQPSGTPNRHPESWAAGSAHEEREGSPLPSDAGCPSHMVRKYRKKHHSRSKDDEEDLEEDHNHSRKKRRSDDYNHHEEEGSRRHRSHRHKHHSFSEDEHRHEKSSRRHRHCCRKHDSSGDDHERSDKKRGKHRSHSGRDREMKDEDIGNGGTEYSDTRSEGGSDGVEDVGTAAGLDTRPADATEIPSDLRAKVRAMLLETL